MLTVDAWKWAEGMTLLYFKKGAHVKPTMSLCEIIQRCFNLLMRLEVTRWNKVNNNFGMSEKKRTTTKKLLSKFVLLVMNLG